MQLSEAEGTGSGDSARKLGQGGDAVCLQCLFGPPKLSRFVLSRDNKVENDILTSLYQTIVQLPQESLMW